MKRTFVMATAAAVLCLTASCSASPSSDRYIGGGSPKAAETTGEQPATTSPAETGANADAAAKADAPPSASAAGRSSEKADSEPPIETKPAGGKQAAAPSPSPTRESKASRPVSSPPPAKQAQQNNESANQAVADSILAKGSGSVAKNDPTDEPLAQAAEQLRSLVKELKQGAEDGDTDAIADLLVRIAQSWDGMKDDVSASYSDMADFLQDKIDSLNDMRDDDPIDSKKLLQLDYELYQALRQLGDKAETGNNGG